MPRTGHVALAGRPNVGKSTLLNALVGTHLAIVSPKAQATRLPVVGLLTEDDTQFIFHDLPGLLDPEYLLHERMLALAVESARRANVVLQLHRAAEYPAPDFHTLLPPGTPIRAPILPVYTQVDLLPEGRSLPPGTLATDAPSGRGIPELLAAIRPHLPEQPFQYDSEDVGTQPLRFFVTEYLREAAFGVLEDELPYALVAEVEEFRETTSPVYIRATLFVERESQKGILIGEGGRTIKAIGQHARLRLEALLGEKVYLETWAKVLPRWRKDSNALRRFGFPDGP